MGAGYHGCWDGQNLEAVMNETAELLLRWSLGDLEAIGTLAQREAEWIEKHVRRRLGAQLRRRVDTQDIVQQTLVEVLRSGPRFVCSDRAHMRALLARMVENVICGQAAQFTAQKRDVRRDAPASADTGSVLILDAQAATVTQPGEAAHRSEVRDWVRLALELLDPEDRNVIVWREYEELPFATIASRLGIQEDAARMRFARAMPKLAQRLKALRAGKVGELLGSGEA